MSYDDALKYIHEAKKFPKAGLERFKSFLNLIGNPQDKLKFIHVAGTNGKGSTCAMLSSVLTTAGYKTGLYISPFIVRFNERISVNQNDISDDALTRLCEYIKPFNKKNTEFGFEMLSEFETVTAIAFLYFLEQNCDIVVLETGLGGRLDATNAQNPILSVITLVDYDHMNILGDTIEKIAFEKSGIIKLNTPIVSYPCQNAAALEVISETAKRLNAPLYIADIDNVTNINFDENGAAFTLGGRNFKVSLVGKHQMLNALTVIKCFEALKGFEISENDIKNGLENTKFPARLEKLKKNPLVYFDGAHNISGAKMLYKNITDIFPGRKLILVLGVLAEKGVGMFSDLIKSAQFVLNVTPDTNRAMNSAQARLDTEKINSQVIAFETVEKALLYAEELSKKYENSLILATGSLYLASDVKKYYSRTI